MRPGLTEDRVEVHFDTKGIGWKDGSEKQEVRMWYVKALKVANPPVIDQAIHLNPHLKPLAIDSARLTLCNRLSSWGIKPSTRHGVSGHIHPGGLHICSETVRKLVRGNYSMYTH
jgi:hypothetical protein